MFRSFKDSSKNFVQSWICHASVSINVRHLNGLEERLQGEEYLFWKGRGIFTESEKSTCQTKHSQRVWPVLTTFVWPDFFTETSRLGIVENGMLLVL